MRITPACPECGHDSPELIEELTDDGKDPNGKPVKVRVYECGCGHRFAYIDYDARPPNPSSPSSP